MVKVQGESHVVGDLFRGSLAETHFEKRTGQDSFKTPNDLTWTLMGLASWSGKPASVDHSVTPDHHHR